MKTSLAKGIGLALATEVAADSAVIGGVLSAKGKVPRAFVAVAGCLAVAGLALLARMLPVLEDEVVKAAVEQGWADRLDGDDSLDADPS